MACASPPLLPTPPRDHFLPPHSATGRWDWGGKKPGRASSSDNWTADKLLARASSSDSWTTKKVLGRASSSDSWTCKKPLPCSSSLQDVPGRASLSENWNKDKAERQEGVFAAESERAGRSPSREDARIGCKRSPSRAPSADRLDKKAKSEAEVDSAAYYYAGPAFIKSPDPSELPIPNFLKKPSTRSY